MTPPVLADVQAAFAATVVDEWVRAGLDRVVVCPGSRSTPLLAALAKAEEEGRLRLTVVLDERSAGFFALGWALAQGRPAPVVVTSGTAAVELHPAVVEAHQAHVPLIVVTADRPPELHQVGAPQTVEQAALFTGALRFVAEPGVADLASAGSWRSLASRVVAEAVGAGTHPPGPVHLNLAFREPLLAADPSAAAALIPPGRDDQRPWHGRWASAADSFVPPAGLADRLGSLAQADRGLIVAGGGAGPPEAIASLSAATGWPVLADWRSGARRPGTVGAADALLRTSVAGWRPEVVLRLGTPWASKVLNQWLAAQDVPQILVDPWGSWADPDRRVELVLAAGPAAVAGALIAARGGRPPEPGWAAAWGGAERAAQAAIDTALPGLGLSEPGVARRVVGCLASGSTLFASSSMPVRDLEWWGAPRPGLQVQANRGANGIDGVISTAAGMALVGPTAALVGDLAFLYDAGALAPAAAGGAHLTVVVTDNDGGGIFGFLPQAGAVPPARFERLWGTPHGLDLVALARAYGVRACAVADLDGLEEAVTKGVASGEVNVIVAHTDRRRAPADHAALHGAIAAALCDVAAPDAG
jgi:2-succinyl-5-enolpyruvyl-6-hydroxy-3-cyclohexene-1-carboxylate synthase